MIDSLVGWMKRGLKERSGGRIRVNPIKLSEV
jgi:hypothetical protein